MLGFKQFSPVLAVTALASLVSGCGPQPEILILNRLAEPVQLDVSGPKESLTGGCSDDFRERFCREEFVALSILRLEPGEERVFTMSDELTETQCTNVLWIRMLQVGDVGPVSEKGTQLKLPVLAEIEEGAGRYHTAAFPQASLRIDEVGVEDNNQGFSPKSCAEYGREAR